MTRTKKLNPIKKDPVSPVQFPLRFFVPPKSERRASQKQTDGNKEFSITRTAVRKLVLQMLGVVTPTTFRCNTTALYTRRTFYITADAIIAIHTALEQFCIRYFAIGMRVSAHRNRDIVSSRDTAIVRIIKGIAIFQPEHKGTLKTTRSTSNVKPAIARSHFNQLVRNILQDYVMEARTEHFSKTVSSMHRNSIKDLCNTVNSMKMTVGSLEECHQNTNT